MIKASNNPLPHDPNDQYPNKLDKGGYSGSAQDLKNEIDALALPDEITKSGIVLFADNTLSIPAFEFEGRINTVSCTNELDFSSEINLAGTGNKRVDIFVLTEFNAIVKIEGEVTVGAFFKRLAPEGTLECAYLEVDGDTILTPTTTIVGDQFIKKIERQKVIISSNVSSFTLDDERHFVEFTNAAQANFNYFILGPNYVSGQNHPFRIRNNTGLPFTLNHLTPSGSSFPGETLLFFPNALPFDLKNKEIIEFVYDTDNNRYEYFGIINDLDVSGKENASNKTDTITGNEASSSLYSSIKGIVDYFTGSKIRSLLGITTLSGSNTGDETTASLKTKLNEELAFALSDETSNLTVGNLITFRMPFAMTLTSVRISVNTAPTISSIIVDAKESGVSIFSTLLSIDATEKTSVTATTPAVISDVNLADDAEITVSTTQIGSGVAGAGLKIIFIGNKI